MIWEKNDRLYDLNAVLWVHFFGIFSAGNNITILRLNKLKIYNLSKWISQKNYAQGEYTNLRIIWFRFCDYFSRNTYYSFSNFHIT